MLLSHRYNFLFVHIAKTGGTSVRVALKQRTRADRYFPLMFLCSRLSHLTGHKLACKLPRHSKIVAAEQMLPREFFAQLFKFAFVRNPWDLQVSSFHHIRRERPHLLQGHTEFESFLRYKLDAERLYQYHLDTSIELQSDYLVDLHGKVIVDFIGRYERLQEDFDQVCERVGLKRVALPHRRQAKDRSDYRRYYSDATAELVSRHFSRDIELFGYEFDAGAPVK